MERLWTSVPDGTSAEVKAIADTEHRTLSAFVAHLILSDLAVRKAALDKEPKQ